MKNKLVGLDTNIFIYQFEAHPQFGHYTQNIFSQLASNRITAVTSVITYTEVLSFKRSDKIISELKNLLLEVPNLEMKDVSRDIAEEAARIRRVYKFHLPDAIQLATALQAKADIFITNDTKLQSFKEIKVLTLSQFTKAKK